MARRLTGRVIPTTTARGAGWAMRFTAYGERRYVTLGDELDGWTERKAQAELDAILALVRVGRWQPDAAVAAPPVAHEDPTFHVFASEWLASVERDLRPNTVLDYRWQLTHHLLPFFARHTLRQIDVREVDRYRDHKLREGKLGPESINKTLTRLGQILERAVEYELIGRNPVRVGRRKVKTSKAPRSYLDDAVQVADLLAAAGELDGEARADRRHVPRRALIATLAFTGLRIGELLALQWRHIDLAGGRLRVEDAKTAAGIRHVTLQPVLRDELLALRAEAPTTSPSAPVFATARGHAMSVDNVRSRVFGAAVNRANERRQEAGQPPLPANLTPHSLRRTYISALLALGWEVPVVMAEVGHSDPKVTLGIYAQVMRRDDASRDRLRALLEGRDFGSKRQREVAQSLDAAMAADPRNDETPTDAGVSKDGRGGFRTCDLSRVKRALSH